MTKTNPQKKDQVIVLENRGQLAAFIKSINNSCHLRFGEVGQNVTKDVLFATIVPGEKPHYNSLRIHPTTGNPIPGQRVYEKEPIQLPPPGSPPPSGVQQRAAKAAQSPAPKYYASAEEKQEDEYSSPLTSAAQNKLDLDIVRWQKERETEKSEQQTRKNHDDACIAMICEHIGPDMFLEIEISPLYVEWRKRGHDCINRSVFFLRMAKELLSSGNATEAVEAMTHLFSIKQSLENNNPSAFINQINEAFERTLPLIEDEQNPGMINAKQLKTILLISGFNKNLSANKQGIKDHLRDNPDDALTTPGKLVAAVIKAHMSDINEERVSDQGSALAAIAVTKTPAKKTAVKAWTPHKNKPDKSQIPGEVHCANCFALTKKYFYGHPPDECNRTAESEKARKEKNAKLYAKVAAVEAPTPSPASVPAPTIEELVKEGVRAFMAQAGWSQEEDA